MIETRESLRQRHDFMMQQHEIHMRRSNMRAVLLIALLVFILLSSVVILVNPSLIGARSVALDRHLVIALIIYTAALLVLVLDNVLLSISRVRAIEMSIKLTQLAFELGRLVGPRRP